MSDLMYVAIGMLAAWTAGHYSLRRLHVVWHLGALLGLATVTVLFPGRMLAQSILFAATIAVGVTLLGRLFDRWPLQRRLLWFALTLPTVAAWMFWRRSL